VVLPPPLTTVPWWGFSRPLMLVSDVLESCYGEVHHAPANRQLLLRVRSETGLSIFLFGNNNHRIL
jgi:hypothetical protein